MSGPSAPPDYIDPGQGKAPALSSYPGAQNQSLANMSPSNGTFGTSPLAPAQGVNPLWSQLVAARQAPVQPPAPPQVPVQATQPVAALTTQTPQPANPGPSPAQAPTPTQIKAPAAQSVKKSSESKFDTFLKILGSASNVAGSVAAIKGAFNSPKTASAGILKGGGVGGLSAAGGVNLQPASVSVQYNPNNRAQVQYDSSPLKVGSSDNSDLIALLKSLKGRA